jgi:hypothetical protein
MQLDIMQVKRKHEEVEKALLVLCPKCTRKDANNECPLKIICLWNL